MVFNTAPYSEKRKDLKQALRSGKLLRFPGAFSPLTAMMIQKMGFEGVYISGAVMSAELGMPDIGLTTMTEVTRRGREIARATVLPSIIDIDTGFGEPMNVARTVSELQDLGISGCHLEDQANPKRCGHLDGKELVAVEEMTRKIKAAVDAKKDINFCVIARTDANATEGLDKAIDRAKAYVDAGAEVIFPEALKNEAEFEKFRKAVHVPLLANMTEFGKSPLLTTKQLENLGYNIVIYPVTTLRIAMKAVEQALQHISIEGSQEGLLDKMQHRKELYELLNYESFNSFDKSIFNFEV